MTDIKPNPSDFVKQNQKNFKVWYTLCIFIYLYVFNLDLHKHFTQYHLRFFKHQDTIIPSGDIQFLYKAIFNDSARTAFESKNLIPQSLNNRARKDSSVHPITNMSTSSLLNLSIIFSIR